MPIFKFYMHLLVALVTTFSCLFIESAYCQIKDIYYKIPDPFEGHTSSGFFAIESFQVAVTASKKQTQTKVTEYFSLSDGLTFSTHRDQDDNTKVWALIGDGQHGKTYLVKNPESRIEFECELDHTHHHRHVFPWQYVYDEDQYSTKRDDRKKEKSTRKRFVYGVGGIWLNGIDRKLVSNEVDEDSPYPYANLWLMREGDLDIKLLFEKPKKRGDMDKLIAASKLETIQIRRQRVVDRDHDRGSGNLIGDETENITIQGFKTDITYVTSSDLRRFYKQLARCRHETEKHRLFPSLMKALSLSPKRLYGIEYLETKHARYQKNHVASGSFDETRNRHVWDIEFNSEWFSLQKETQVSIYEGLPKQQTDFGMSANDDEHLFIAEVFLKRFTENEKGRSSRHSTVCYHFIERDGAVETCKVGDNEPLPTDHLMIRPIHFHRDETDAQLTGKLTGVGALIMNVADIHYKQFSLFKREILVANDQSNLYARVKMTVDEWRIYDQKTGRNLHFYFKEKTNDHEAHEISDLVRIDIRDAKAIDLTDSAIEKASEDNEYDVDMMIRFDIVNFKTDEDDAHVDVLFTSPKTCTEQRPPSGDTFNHGDDDDDDDSEKSDNDDPEDIFNDDDDYGKNYNSDEEKDDENEDQDEGEDFELDSGKMMDSFDFPDFFEFLDGQPSYRMESSIEIEGKRLILREQVDVEKEWAAYSLYLDEKSDSDTEYFVNYKSELIFKTGDSRKSCQLVDEVEPWFRLLSEKMTYLKSSSSGLVVKESNKLRLYGLGALWRRASDSLYTDFIGMKKEIVRGPANERLKPVLWSLMEDGDSYMDLEFTFLWNVTRWEMDMSKKRNRRSFEMLSFDSVRMLSSMDYEGNPSKFKEFKIKLNSFHKIRSTALTLPASCQALLIEAAQKEASESDFQGDISIPSIFDFLGSSDTYSIRYTIGHPIMDQGNRNSPLQSVTESYDRKKNKGKIITGHGEDTVEIFIDGANKAIYSFARNICKRITDIKALVDLGARFSVENFDFDLTKMWGLAALWIRIAKFENAFLKVTHRHDISGNQYEVRTYRAISSWSISNFDITSYTIFATFVMKPQQASGNLGGKAPAISDSSYYKPILQRLEFIPQQVRGVSGFSLHRSQIDIKSISRDEPVDWILPEQCAQLSAKTDGKPGASDISGEFPRLKKYVQQTNRFHMRSEATVSKPMINEEKTIFLIDEWFYNKNFHLTTYGLNKNIDFMIYGDSMESFDLSIPYRCSPIVPRFGPTDDSAKSDAVLKRFWNDDTSLILTLSNLYYGPASLWWLAEKNIDNVRLENSIDIAPKPNLKSSTKSDLDKLAKEMRTEVWKVSSPPNTSKSWSYYLHFEKFSTTKVNATVREWHVLQRIELEEPDILGMKKFVEIDVINYSWDQSKREMVDKFLLPEGYGCTRKPAITSKFEENADELVVDTDNHYSFSYEATLELSPEKFAVDSQTGDYVELKERAVSPTLIGTYVRRGRIGVEDFYMDVVANYNRVRYLNGTMTSTKTVYDNTRSLLYEIDRLTGYCRIGSATSASSFLKLEFPFSDTHKETIEFYRELFGMLFLKTTKEKSMVPLNRYVSDGKLITVYEETLKDFRLTSNIAGFATLTRRYVDDVGAATLKAGETRKHNSMSVQISIMNEAKTKVRAIFNIAVQRVWNINLAELIRSINVAQCYNDGNPNSDKRVRSFALDYHIEQGSNPLEQNLFSHLSHHLSNQMEADFIRILLKQALVVPTQLDGVPRVEFGRNGLMRFYFNLLEGPTAIEYFLRRPGYTMPDKIASEVEIKLVSSVIECSKWCDSIGCIVMSYCGDRTCRVATANMLSRFTNGIKSTAFLLEMVQSIPSSDCVYFSKVAMMQIKTLDTFSRDMDMIVNYSQDQNELVKLALLFGGSKPTNPSTFHDLKKNFRSINEDSESTNEATEMMTATIKNNAIYTVLKHDHKIDTNRFAKVSAESGRFESKVEQVHSYNECLNKCKIVDCIVTSFCKEDYSCVVVTGKGDTKQLESTYEPKQGGCTITVRDFLASYSRFGDTIKPTSFEKQLDDYSALECAAACDGADGDGEHQFNCLSFDSCVIESESKGSGGRGEDKTRKSVCFLQKMHIMQDSFDRMILDSSNVVLETRNKQRFICEHYSKSVLADYNKIPNKMFMKSNNALRGSNAERCALDCQEDDECWAFEYCFDDMLQPSQTCYFIRSSEVRSIDALKNWRVDLEKLLQVSKYCSIYTFKHDIEQYQIDANSHAVALLDTIQVAIIENRSNFLKTLVITLIYLASAIVVGSVIQLAFIRIRGRPLELIK